MAKTKTQKSATIIYDSKKNKEHFVIVFDAIDKKTINKLVRAACKNMYLEKKIWEKEDLDYFKGKEKKDGRVYGFDIIAGGSHSLFTCGRTIVWDGWDEMDYVNESLTESFIRESEKLGYIVTAELPGK